jgi:RND family efflux transporter MFP subunit
LDAEHRKKGRVCAPDWRRRITALLLPLFAASLLFGGCSGGKNRAGDEASEERSIPVVLTSAAIREFEDRLVLQGNLEAKHFAVVPALVAGAIETFFVDEGDEVIANETKLFQIDSLKLEKALEVSRQDLAMARCGNLESAANLERVQADFDKAELDYGRFQRLLAQNAVTKDAFEGQESRYKQTKAVLKHAHTLVNLAQERERQAEAALAIAEKHLKESLGVAPISGRVSARILEVGEMADTGKPVLRIDDPSVIEVSAFLPAQYYPRVQPDETLMRVQVHGIELGELPVSYKSPTIHPKLRTFEVKCLLNNPPEGVIPGAIAELSVSLERRTALGVPSSAVVFRENKAVVFVVENDRARIRELTTGLSSDGWVEVRSGNLAEGTPVATMGQFLLKDGIRVTVQQETQ